MTRRGTHRSIWLFALLLLLCSAAPLRGAGEYRTVEVESLQITIDSEWAPRTAPGYVPVRFDITNLGDARVIQIVGHGRRFFRRSRSASQGGIDILQSVRLARGDRVRLTIPVPVYADNENVNFEIRENGRTLERFSYASFLSGSAPDDASVLIVAARDTEFGKAAARWPRTIAARTSGPTRFVMPAPSRGAGITVTPPTSAPSRPLDFVLDPVRLPTNWLGFTSLRAVVIGPAEWELLEDTQKTALLTWTACGGDLFFVDGDLGLLFPAGKQPRAAAPEGSVRAYFFGRIHLPTSASIEASGLADLLTKAASLQDQNWALPANRALDWGSVGRGGFRLPIPGVGSVPARAYLLILIAFSLLIGPANYWFLWRRGLQVLVVLTAPVISAVFIILLGGYVIAGEGVGVRARTVTFTMLDQARTQAATRASMSLYAAGTAPWDGLRFARDEAVYTIGPGGTGSREAQVLDLTEAQRFASGVIQARSATNLETIGFRPARERLTFSREADGITVLNGLGVPIRALTYRTGNRLHHLPDPVMPGEKGRLVAGGVRTAGLIPADVPQAPRFQALFQRQPDGSYLAVLDRSPFWTAGVSDVDERDSFHVVIGWVDGQP